MLRIGIDTMDMLIARTGSRTFLQEICSAMMRVRGRHEIIYFQPRGPGALGNGRSLGSKVYEHLRFIYWKQIALPYLARKNRCDVLFCADYFAPLSCSAKTVVVFHDGLCWECPEHYGRLWKTVMADGLALRAAKRAACVITVSEYSRRRIADLIGVPYSRIRVVANAPKSTASGVPDPGSIRKILARYGVGFSNPFALHVGVLEKRKNLPRLVEAFSLFLRNTGYEYKLILVGPSASKKDMDDSQAVRGLIERLNLSERVKLVGYVPDEDLVAFYRAARFLVFPSLREGFGIPVLEAFVNDLPVMASNSTAIPEVAGDAALLFDPTNLGEMAEGMRMLAGDSRLMESLREKGRSRSALYSWEKSAGQLMNIFESGLV